MTVVVPRKARASARPFALLDRDGTVIEDRGYIGDPDDVVLLPGAAAGLRRLRALGFGLVLVTNQSGLGRGYFDAEQLDAVHRRLGAVLADERIVLDGIYLCPHRPDHDCDCRKPRPGLGLRAAEELGIDLAASVMIGDKRSDIDFGRRLGARTILVRTGHGAQTDAVGTVPCTFVAGDLHHAGDYLAALTRREDAS